MNNGLFKLGLLGLFWTSLSFSATVWDVAVVFLGSKLPEDYQADIDRNILDLAKSNPNSVFHLSIFREFGERTVTYFVDPASAYQQSWKPLFHKKEVADVLVAGELIAEIKEEGEPSILNRPVKLSNFFQRAFSTPNSKRFLLLYDHGNAFQGLGSGISLIEMKQQLMDALPKRPGKPLDILWMDACFMANVETAYELRKVSKLIIASEEAEFSAGAPMDMFKSLSYGDRPIDRVAVDFAERFIESYSYTLLGSKRKSVFSSSATISVVDTSLLDDLVKSIKQLKVAIGIMTAEQVNEIRNQINSLNMESKDLVDLGSLVLFMSKNRAFTSNMKIREVLFNLRAKLEVGRPAKNRKNPRIILDLERLNSKAFVFGYNDWKNGHEKDQDTLDKLPDALREPVSFVKGPELKKWPKKILDNVLFFSPFSVGLNIFNYYGVEEKNDKRTSRIKSLVRLRDFVLEPRETRLNPIILSGFSQGVGQRAERYTGLNIADPTGGLPSFDYTDLEFYKATGWTSK